MIRSSGFVATTAERLSALFTAIHKAKSPWIYVRTYREALAEQTGGHGLDASVKTD